MHKRHLYHILKRLRQLRGWYFVIAILISMTVSAVALRQNNITALRLRDNVLKIDEQNGDVESALRELRRYVYSHMNTDLTVQNGAYPPVQLKYRYDRLARAETERVSAANAQLYTEAQGYCESLIPTGRSLNRIDCIQNYITGKGGAVERPVEDSLYKFAFTPPVWSPDLAGWSLVITALLTTLFILRLVLVTILKHQLRS